MSSSRKTCMFYFFGLITYHLRWITYISSKWLHTATSCGLNYVLRHIAIFRWTVAKPMGNEQSEAIGALRRKIPSSGPKKRTKWKLRSFLSNPKDWYVIRLLGKRYVIKPIGLYVSFLRIDYIHFFEMITHRNKLRITFTALPWLHTFSYENDYIPSYDGLHTAG